MTSSTENPGSKVGRARRSISQLWQVPAFLLGLFVFLGVAVSAPWRQTPQAREFDARLASLRTAVAQESGDADMLVSQAESILQGLSLFRGRAAEAHFLAGSAYYRQAKQKPAAGAKVIWPRAVEQFEHAQTLGVPDADRAALQYRLGYALLQQDKELPRALEMLMLSVEKGGEPPLQGYQLLVQANLKLTKPNLDAALTASQRVLDLTPMRDAEALALAQLQHAEILLKKEQRGDAVKVLEQMSLKAPRPIRTKAKMLQTRCLEEDGHFDKAIALWKDLLGDATQVEGGRARIQYQLGLCYLRSEPRNTNEAIHAWSDALKVGGPEGQAAGLRLGELRLALGDKESAQAALADWKQALAKVNGPQDYRNPHIELKKVCEWFDQAIARFQKQQDPEKTQEVAALYGKIAPVGTAEKLIAEAAEAFAKQKSEQFDSKIGKVSRVEVLAQFRRAGEAYERAAKARPEAERPGLIWHAAQCYLSADAPDLAQSTLNLHVKIELNEQRLAKSWCILGDLYRVQGQKDAARKAYLKCLEYPNTPYACKSGYFLALEEIDKKNYKQACAILKQNLELPGDLERTWQEKSQFKLGTLLMQLQSYEEARVHLNECVRVYPGSPNALTAREQLGECYRSLAAREEAKEKEIDKLIAGETDDVRRLQMDEGKRAHRKRRIEHLNDAITTYEKLRDDLRSRPREMPLGKLEEVLLRRAWFGIGECHWDNEQYFEAKEAFRGLQLAHRQSLEAFFACSRLCHMPERIAIPQQSASVREEAKESLRMVAEDLKAMPADHETFRIPGAPARADWLDWTDKMQKKLNAPPQSDGGSNSR